MSDTNLNADEWDDDEIAVDARLLNHIQRQIRRTRRNIPTVKRLDFEEDS